MDNLSREIGRTHRGVAVNPQAEDPQTTKSISIFDFIINMLGVFGRQHLFNSYFINLRWGLTKTR